MRIKKSKFFKVYGFGSLAVMMAVAGTFAFAPLGATTSGALANENQTEMTTSGGLGLDPKNDPVVYTTESGLEIRMSNATKYSGTTSTVTNLGTAYTQDLTSFYYFTMGTYSGTIYTAKNNTETYTVSNAPVNWIILGLGPNTGYFLDEVTANLFSTWKTNTENVNNNYANKTSGGAYFFKEIFESATPAGSAINSVVPSKSYVMEKIKASIPSDPADEIPDGCMLVISEKLLGQMYFNSSGNISNATWWHTHSNWQSYLLYGSGYYGNRYRFIGSTSTTTEGGQSWNTTSNAGGSLYNYINNLFSKNNSTGAITGNNNLGFTQVEANMIVPQQLYTYYSNGSNKAYGETPSTDGNTYYSMFPLAYRAANSSIKQNFCIEDYLTNSAQRVATFIGANQSFFWWLRSAGTYDGTYTRCCSYVVPNGTLGGNVVDGYYGVRPAMVMKLK